MVGDENHFQKGSQLQEEITSGISKGRKVNEKQFSPYFRFQSLVPISFPQELSSKEKHEHNVIYCNNVKPCSKGASSQENHVITICIYITKISLCNWF